MTLGVTFLGIVLLAFNLRSAVTTISPLLDDIRAGVGLSSTVAGLLGALPALAFAVAGLVGVPLLRKFTAERLAVAVLLIEAAGQVVRPWVGSAVGFLVVTLVTLVGMGVGNVILSALVKAWFPRRIGTVTAAYTTAIAIGTSLPALVAVPVAGARGWQQTLAMWGLVALVVAPMWVVTARTPRALPPTPLLGADARPHRIRVHRSSITWGLTLVFGMNSLNTYAMIAWLPARLVDAGASHTLAGAMLALFAAVGIVPALVMPALLQRFGRAGTLTAVCVALFVVGYLGLLLAPMNGTLLWTSLAGIGGGGFPLVLTLFGLRSATPATAGALSGFAQTIGYLCAATGPLLVGLLHEVSGGWTLPFSFLLATLVVMLVGGYLSSPTHTVDEDLLRKSR